MATMSTHRVNIMKPSGPAVTGNGAFTYAESIGTNIPVQSVWF